MFLQLRPIRPSPGRIVSCQIVVCHHDAHRVRWHHVSEPEVALTRWEGIDAATW